MKDFTERDLDRQWSPDELDVLSEGDLTKLSFLRNYKNFIFFVPTAFVLYFIGQRFGVIGKILGWVGIVGFSLFALEGLFSAGKGFISLIGTPFFDKTGPGRNSFWKSLQVLISLSTFAIYAFLAAFAYWLVKLLYGVE